MTTQSDADLVEEARTMAAYLGQEDGDLITRLADRLEELTTGEYVVWGRAFKQADGTIFVDDQDGSFRDFEDAAQNTRLRWEGSAYDFVVRQYRTPWEPVEEGVTDDHE